MAKPGTSAMPDWDVLLINGNLATTLPAELACRIGANPCACVIRSGEIVRGRLGGIDQ